MLKIRIIPCLDVKDARVVKGVNFVDLIDAGSPAKCAKAYDEMGADEIILLDITASSDKRNTTLGVVEETAKQVFMPLTVGGGVRKIEDVRQLLKMGADKVSINTQAVIEPEFVEKSARQFGTQAITVAVDAKAVDKNNDKWQVYINGGRKETGIDLLEWVKKMEMLGAGEILLTSMDRDGTKQGFNIEMTKAVSDCMNIPLIASGGVGNLDHLVDAVRYGGASAVLAASIFHFGTYTIEEAKLYMKKHSINVRI